MSHRIKLPATIITRDRAEQLLGEIAALKIDERHEQNKMDKALTAVRERHELTLTATRQEIENRTVMLESWAAANPGEFPKDRKSIAFTHGIIGYRTGTPKLKTLAKWTWERVLAALEQGGWEHFIRTKREVNKEAIIAASAEAEPGALKAIGVQVVQDETFYVEPKLAEQEARETVGAA